MSQLLSPCSPALDHGRPSEIIPGLLPDTYTVLAIATARIYHAQLTAKVPEWCYSRMKGRLVFAKDTEPERFVRSGTRELGITQPSNYWFRLLDSTSGRPIWFFNVPAGGFVYELDRPFFHAFQGKSRRFGFLFEDDDEAHVLAQKVFNQTRPPRPVKSRSLSLSIRSKISSSSLPRGHTFPPVISLPTPNSFVHVGHVGMNKEGTIQATSGIDPSWKAILEGNGWRDSKTPTSRPFPISEEFQEPSRHVRSTKVA